LLVFPSQRKGNRWWGFPLKEKETVGGISISKKTVAGISLSKNPVAGISVDEKQMSY